MIKAEAIHEFWSSFGWPAYDENTVPDDAEFPYITYNVVTDSLGNQVSLNADLWDYKSHWTSVELKKDEIAADLEGGVAMELDDGYIELWQGTPFAQRLPDETNEMVRRIYLNITAEFITRS